MPVAGRLADVRAESTVDRAVSVSPGYTGWWNEQASTPRKGPPASLRSSTDSPTTVHRTNIGLTTTPGWSCALANSALTYIGFQLHIAVVNSAASPSLM